ncbi:unnamed protein product [Arabidopsis thaliana]|uniref:Uncharacterized protein n=1 Tax=Arabidopsis thaliana TaxID=3702 RepID=A0A5S9X161_ARATH|nr:unnamed protein product [Arabidopsis thaliana]
MHSKLRVVYVLLILFILFIGYAICDVCKKSTYCEKVRSKTAPRDVCKKSNGNALCKKTCWTIEKYVNGKCLILPKTTNLDCYCYHYDNGSACRA